MSSIRAKKTPHLSFFIFVYNTKGGIWSKSIIRDTAAKIVIKGLDKGRPEP